MTDLSGRRCLLTGASGGIGTAIGHALVAAGAHIIVVGRRREALDELVRDWRSEAAVAHSVAGDLTSAEACERIMREAERRLGGIDVVVNCAGQEGPIARVADITPEDWDDAIRANLSSAFYLGRAALPVLERSEAGAIINITSVVSQRAWKGYGALCASKAGVELLTRVIALEYADRGIRAVCVAPGVVDAGMTDSVTDPQTRAEWSAAHAAGRMAQPGEVAEAVVWLASTRASFVTGSTIFVDGGFMA